jgi:hypothetical protein
MTCERYWREGILLVERGVDDPHRSACADCTSAHASRQELVEALPLIGAGRAGNPRWQRDVWRRIDRKRAPVLGRWRWPLASLLAVACVVALWLGRGGLQPGEARPVFEAVEGDVAMRTSSVVAGARLRVRVNATSEVWLYRAGHLELRCRARQGSGVCARDPGGMTVETVLATVGRYTAFAVEAPGAPPPDQLDEARAALESAGTRYLEHRIVVR